MAIRREVLARNCLAVFLAINLPFWFLAAHVPLLVQRVLGLGLLAIAGYATRRMSLHPSIILIWIFFLLLNASKFFLSSLTLQYTIWFTGLPVVIALGLLFTLEREPIDELFGSLCWIVIIATIPGVIVWFAFIAGIDLPYSLISLSGRGELYRSYSGLAIVGDYSLLTIGGITISRLCGMFEEPGLLGSVLGVLLAIDVVFFPGRHASRKLLLTSFGFLTGSLAFFVMLSFVAIHFVFASGAKLGRTVLAALFVTMLQATSNVASQAAELFFLGRLEFNGDRGVYGNNRAVYGERFTNEYLTHAPLSRVLLGNGPSSNSENAEGGFSSYVAIVYENGVLASLLLLGFLSYFATVPLTYWRSPIAFLALLGPFLSLYQRPDFQGTGYLVLFAMLFVHRRAPPVAVPRAISFEPAIE
jgi:hypothetical protein